SPPGGYFRMLLSRRQVIEAGAATAALGAMSSPLLAAATDKILPARPTAPAQPRAMADPILDPRMVARARAAFDQHRASIQHIDVVGIADFTKPSADPRFYLL